MLSGMILGLVYFILRSFLYGFLCASTLLTEKESRPNFLLLFSLAFPMGFGITSCIYFAWLMFHGPGGPFWILDPLLIPLLIYHLHSKGMFKPLTVQETKEPPNSLFPERMMSLLFWPVILTAVFVFLFFSIQEPHGQWDAWATWNLRARYLFQAGAHWRETFTRLVESTNPDYPLLLPTSVAQGWYFIGKDSQVIPILIGFLFTFSTVAILYSFTRIHRNRFQAQFASFVLLCSPLFLNQGSAQIADIPLSCYYLMTIGFLVSAEIRLEGRKEQLILAGISTGFAAWTKNEGNLFLLIVITIALAHSLQGSKEKLLRSGYIFFGTIPALLCVVIFKLFVSSSGYVLMKGTSAFLGGVTDLKRALYLAQQFLYQAVNIGKLKVSLLFLLLLYAVFLGIRKEQVRSITVPLANILLCLVGYYFFYLITPLDYRWQASTSLERLFLQTLPSVLFLFFFLAKTPLELTAADDKN
jgi:hypothetical protein